VCLSTGPMAATLAGVEFPPPDSRITSLPPCSYFPKGPMQEAQPCLEVGVLRGTNPHRGRMTIDTGAAFTLISDEVAKAAGLLVKPHSASYKTADGSPAPIVGKTDIDV
jgi:hypothetical protein